MDKLKLNHDKTELMIIGSRQQLDRNLKFDAQITKTCCTGYYYLHNIRKIRKYLTLDSTRCLVHALVMGRVDYCNGLLYGVPRNNISKLKRFLNMVARLITILRGFVRSHLYCVSCTGCQ